jgi:hypothetical protein
MTLEVDEEAGGSDFTIISLPEGVTFPFGGSTILVPEIYTTFWDLVAKDDADWQTRQESPEPHTFSTHSTIITGQPGIGWVTSFVCFLWRSIYHIIQESRF